MIKKENSGIVWLEFELLADLKAIKHAVFLRHGGLSTGELASLNFGFSVGDHPEHVKNHYKAAASLLNLPNFINGQPSICSSKQRHGVEIWSVNASNLSEEPFADAIVTQEKGVGLLIKHADCQAALFYDPIRHVIANVHCGWRGNVQNIYHHVVQYLIKTYGSKPENLLVCIGPSLGPQSAEFVNYQKELPESFWKYQIRPFYFDLWALSRAQLKEAGVLDEHIEIAHIDTFANAKDCYSYRREKPSGRHASVIALSPH